MAYARFSAESDVYVYDDVDGFIRCCGCALDDDFQCDTWPEMEAHLRRHEAGHAVPARLMRGADGPSASVDELAAIMRETPSAKAFFEWRAATMKWWGDVTLDGLVAAMGEGFVARMQDTTQPPWATHCYSSCSGGLGAAVEWMLLGGDTDTVTGSWARCSEGSRWPGLPVVSVTGQLSMAAGCCRRGQRSASSRLSCIVALTATMM